MRNATQHVSLYCQQHLEALWLRRFIDDELAGYVHPPPKKWATVQKNPKPKIGHLACQVIQESSELYSVRSKLRFQQFEGSD